MLDTALFRAPLWCVPRSRRDVDTFEFTPPAFERVAGYLHYLTEAGKGWINLLPGVDADEHERQSLSPGFFALFSNRQPPVTMCTLMPASPTKRATHGVTIGLLHPTGSKAVARLADSGVALPAGWLVRQDHARRGLVLLSAHGAPEDEIIDWSLRAGAALCREETTGQWQAEVYLP
ncbi:MAG: hypothetical protein ACLQRH_01000 [Acidimicrobiales bacterium]